MFTVTRGEVLSKTKCSDTLKYPVYSSQTLNKGLMGFYDKYLFENAITWTTDGANAGEVNYRSGKFYCTNVCGVLLSEEGYANECIANILNSTTRKYVSYVGNPKLMNNVMSLIKVTIPKTIEEQLKISKIITTLDKQIDQQENLLTLYKKQKKVSYKKCSCKSKIYTTILQIFLIALKTYFQKFSNVAIYIP